MFTGLIQAVGTITTATKTAEGMCITIDTQQLDLSDVVIGDSVAVNGVCLTVVECAERSLSFTLSAATLQCTVGFTSQGAVNLEKALRLSDRLGGHWVQGHVDGVGEIVEVCPQGDNRLLVIAAPIKLLRYIARKGSITVNGVSLTVNQVENERFTVNLIPHTLSHTNLQMLQLGDKVNIEVDILSRYLERLLHSSSLTTRK